MDGDKRITIGDLAKAVQMITEDKLDEEDLELLVANIMNECDEANKDYLDIDGIYIYIYI